jgi:hypothetical protein
MDTTKPICGVLSVVMPPFGILISGLALWLLYDPKRPQESGVVGVIILFSLFCAVSGIVIGIIGIVRRERFRWLPKFGLVWSIGWTLSHFIR